MPKMTTCRSCGAEIAASAGSCPACGATRTRAGNAVAMAGLIAVIVAVLVVVLYAINHYQG